MSLHKSGLDLTVWNLVTSKWSQFVFVIWMFTAYIVMQSYTANLSSNMTVSRLQHSTHKLYCIGFQDGSFVKEILIKRLDFNVSRIESYASVEQYHDALSKGCHNGGVDDILDELPFIKIFLDKYGETNYKLLGSSYKTGGLGFVCKHFLEVVEMNQYGWFWVFPNGGKSCHYRHALPPGYILKSQMKALLEKEVEKISEDIENQRAKVITSTPMTPELFLEWKKKKMEARDAVEMAERANNDRIGCLAISWYFS
ncbi:hypothetical protein POM88_053059 [Heracleum sosnowskyi]|uniref:Uncharacterized protein n=1 Tax=Heracleum sosnowskyi TaxID=360622 RepID=A0AAD8GQC4_9APIA|nr:hypothetical protein POM88_053059 [Heracleum sosnowskyi]